MLKSSEQFLRCPMQRKLEKPLKVSGVISRKKVERWIIFSFVTTLFVSCGSKEAFRKNHSVQKMCRSSQNLWGGPYPVTLHRHASFPEEYIPALERAMAEWGRAMNTNLFQLSPEVSTSHQDPFKPDGQFIIYWYREWPDHLAELEQGRTSLHTHDNQILEADIFINASKKQFDYFIDDPQNQNQVHLESLLIHELGHVLGLVHSHSHTSIMSTHLKANEVRNRVSLEDSNSLECEDKTLAEI